ncbi:hypothetical protein NLB33_01750 [Mycolicibacterium smegmatis]|uniref:8-oxoguanine DNA glycosylase OGG fold protein n=1 Tax=Mycolicibacterium smegmatis TaxID=1772 RepID=UPI0020A4A2DA|nr:hypothetical protein [Mycolicibacterium smegmatis]MCP2621575.1 hypothetical protein [Mycolicibacterium smegmatis]
MTDGELVRERVPEMLRGAGQSVEARRLSSGDLARALVNKLSEEAEQLTQVVDDREQLISGIAEVTDMLTTLARCQNIEQVEIDAEIHRTLAELGGFNSGTWLVSEIPHIVRRYTSAHVERQRNRWIPERWAGVFAGHEQAHADLREHVEEAGGIARSFLHAQAGRDPVDLFLMTMAWGYQPKDYGPQRTAAVLGQDGAVEKINAIVEATRTDGAAAGWSALLDSHKIRGLGMSFGTKLLYYAGYTCHQKQRPLVLDERVRAALAIIAPGTVPARGWVRRDDYLRYLDLAESWATNPAWNQAPDVVEYALFSHGGVQK